MKTILAALAIALSLAGAVQAGPYGGTNTNGTGPAWSERALNWDN